MISNKEEVQVLAALMLEKGITDIVISPGSRNAPLINTFENIPAFRCFNIVDERSAAFFAMGLALKNNRPVAIACTSGSAMLNYAPAVAEAYYQKIPLLVLSADRPREWVDQAVGQTIRQENALANVVKHSFSLTGGMRDTTEKWYNTREINTALNALTDLENGPVHINLPFSEPLYNCEDIALPKVKSITINRTEPILDVVTQALLSKEWDASERKLILLGQAQPDDGLDSLIQDLSQDSSVVILSEKTSNSRCEGVLTDIDNMLFTDIDEALNPDLLITIGGQLVSKKVKAWLQNIDVPQHWHFSPAAEVLDTFMSLTRVITASPISVLGSLAITTTSGYASLWEKLNEQVNILHKTYLSQQAYSDLTVFDTIFKYLPEKSVLHLSNSTPVRYAQLFPMQTAVYQSNRGTSGIDGVVSTAAGYAHDDDRLNVLVVGDLSFFYDSNALWNQHYPSNFKVILINNGGGGIFKFIEGPNKQENTAKHFIAEHNTQAEAWVRQFGIDYSRVDNLEDLEKELSTFFEKQDTPAFIEVDTSMVDNGDILRGYFSFLKNNIN